MDYAVIAGNVGTVYSGTDRLKATTTYHEYVVMSKSSYGRVSQEPVIFFEDEEIIREFNPELGEGSWL